MSKTSRVLGVSWVLVALMLSPSASADIDPAAVGNGLETDVGLGLQNSDEVQDLDQGQNLSGDPKRLSDFLTDKITTTQAMHAGDEEVSEPVGDDL